MRRSSATRSARVIGAFSIAVVVAACGPAASGPTAERVVPERTASGTSDAGPRSAHPSDAVDGVGWGLAAPFALHPGGPSDAGFASSVPGPAAAAVVGRAGVGSPGATATATATATGTGTDAGSGVGAESVIVAGSRLVSSWPAEFPGAIDAVDAAAQPPDPVLQPLIRRLLWGLAVATDTGERTDAASDPATMAALWRVQRAAGLAATGLVDGPTAAALQAAVAIPADRLPAAALVDLSEQRVYVANAAGAVIALFPVSTGGEGTETPTGAFAVQERIRVGTSETNAVVHMDYFTVFNGGVGFHGIPWVGDRDVRLWTPLGEYGVSHGCVRMDDADAAFLYRELPDGASVVVVD